MSKEENLLKLSEACQKVYGALVELRVCDDVDVSAQQKKLNEIRDFITEQWEEICEY